MTFLKIGGDVSDYFLEFLITLGSIDNDHPDLTWDGADVLLIIKPDIY